MGSRRPHRRRIGDWRSDCQRSHGGRNRYHDRLRCNAPQIYRNPELNYAATYRARIKSLGDDACKQEFQLRTFEAVVAIYCANNPSATIDQAAAAVRSAINREA